MTMLERHPCAVCDTLVSTGHLMCARHWRLVPHELQVAVYSTWRSYRNAEPVAMLIARRDYYASRDAAIAAAQAAMGLPITTTGEQP
ncbi:MAG: hypothetical protein KIT35_21935 [Piscinibacter sp.]|uniref:hypothetical protein n=1 Tax=Piscinibacter sp. TaxID=1903157 RepID=UPI0025900E9A|nr:hypothetical protein [Piscinibacter sp.]MCW5666501.1 hypothetical protein [Piscinibacter sp.]